MSEQTTTPEVDQTLDLNNEMQERRSKLAALRAQGNPFPNDFRRDSLSGDLHAEFGDKSADELAALGKRVKIAGRIMTRRIMGKASFATLQDMAGKIQVYVTRDDLPEGFYNEQFKKWDLGDIVGVEGTLFRTNTGELSVHVSDIRLLTKALRPLPEKHKGLTDQEARCRQRYLDLIANEESRKTFVTRTKVVAGIRKFLNDKRFMEVETPLMQVIPGGASARPFVTHHNALDIDMYLRIATELYLKRLIVGGFEKVYDMGKNFRNEGIDYKHNPEFTMIELYEAYSDYNDMMSLTEDLVSSVAMKVNGSMMINYEGTEIDLTPPWRRVTMADIVKEETGIDFNTITLEEAHEAAKKFHMQDDFKYDIKHTTKGDVLNAMFERFCEDKLIQPTFICDYPVEISPLTKKKRGNEEYTERFEGFIFGREICNAYSELNDPIVQRERFSQQAKERELGDDEAYMIDEEFMSALETGMPPTGGLGIGVDRIVMFLTDAHSIRDIILFPTMKPQE